MLSRGRGEIKKGLGVLEDSRAGEAKKNQREKEKKLLERKP